MGVLFNRGRHSFLSEERSLATVEVMAVSVSLLPVAGIKDPDEGSLRKGYWDHSLKVCFNRGGKSWWAERDLPVCHICNQEAERDECRCSAHFVDSQPQGCPHPGWVGLTPNKPKPLRTCSETCLLVTLGPVKMTVLAITMTH